MQTKIETKRLNKALIDLKKVIGNNSTLPILDCFLLDFQGKKLVLTASDLEISHQITIDLLEEKIGKFAVPSGLFSDISKNIQEKEIELLFNTEISMLDVITTNGTYSIPLYNAEEYPKIKEVVASNCIVGVSSHTLYKVIEKTLKFTGNDDFRPIMTGVNICIENGVLKAAATDTSKLLKYEVFGLENAPNYQFTLSKKTCNTLLTACSEDDIVNINFNDTNALFEFSNQTIIGRLVDGNYPPYENVIPKEFTRTLILSKNALLDSLKRVSILSNKDTKSVSIEVFENCNILIKSVDADYNTKGQERILANSFDGPAIKIGFNSKFLIELLSCIDCETIKINLTQPDRATLIYPESQKENEALTALIMPVTLQ